MGFEIELVHRAQVKLNRFFGAYSVSGFVLLQARSEVSSFSFLHLYLPPSNPSHLTILISIYAPMIRLGHIGIFIDCEVPGSSKKGRTVALEFAVRVKPLPFGIHAIETWNGVRFVRGDGSQSLLTTESNTASRTTHRTRLGTKLPSRGP